MKHNNIFRILAIGVIIGLLVIAIPATPALAQAIYCYPSSGTAGTTVTVYGSGYSIYNGQYVYIFFDYTSVTTAIVTAGIFSATFSVPSYATAGTSYVIVQHTTPVYTPANQIGITTFIVTARQITISPSSGYVGNTVTVSGSGFTPSTSVTILFDTTAVSTVTATATGTFSGATFTVPESYQGTHTVRGSDVSGYSTVINFTVSPKITVTPTSGAVGDIVTINGTGFAASNVITFSFDFQSTSAGTTVTNTNGSFTNNTFPIPASSRGSHTITAQDTSPNYASTTFTVGHKMTITPTSGPSGTTITVSGTGYSASTAITIKYNDVLVTTSPATISTSFTGSFTASFEMPAGPAGTYQVEATDGTYVDSADFTTTADATISQTTTTASPGYVGMELTITGTGFKPNATVTITYTTDPVTLATVTTDAHGAFSAMVTIPPSIAGNHIITATDDHTTKQFPFVMESTAPPIPTLLLPEEGIKAESEAHFDWMDVEDPSGVTYTLWISSDTKFTTTLLEKEGLTSSEYTITEEEKLASASKEEPYYWSVKAIDDASNESLWAPPQSFHVGSALALPTWAIYLLCGIGALLLGVLGFWLGKRRVPSTETNES